MDLTRMDRERLTWFERPRLAVHVNTQNPSFNLVHLRHLLVNVGYGAINYRDRQSLICVASDLNDDFGGVFGG